jgi:hypothetical protein
MQPSHESTIVIENWVSPLSALTPSLIVHNLELQGIQLPQSFTIEIDRGHYDCTDANYAVITVRTDEPILFMNCMNCTVQSQSFYCSFFSQKASQGMDPVILQQYWLGNCYLHMGETAAPVCSFRHESGYVKTWKKVAPLPSPKAPVKAYHLSSPAPSPPLCRSLPPSHQDENNDAMSAVSVDPAPLKSKNKLRIIQLQKKNLLLRTELDMLKSEFRDLKAEVIAMKESLGAVKEDQVGLAQRHKDQEAATKRANQCMQDWTNKQVIERVWILETQHAQLRSEHLKQKEQQQQQQQQQKQQQQQQQQQQCKPKHKSLSKKTKKEIKRLSERLDKLENINNNNNEQHSFCNKCNDNYTTNPFDFREIYDHYDQHHYDQCDDQYHYDAIYATNDTTNDTTNDDSCPSLELIANYYADEPNPNEPVVKAEATDPKPTTSELNEEDSDFDDDDFFEIHVELVQEDGPK